MKIVIVEDESLTAFMFKKLLEENQHEVVGLASRASTAIEVIEELEPDLVIVDINLKDSNSASGQPSMTGLDVCRWVKSRSSAQVLVVSAYISTQDTIEKLKEANADKYLSKPVNEAELLTTVNSTYARGHEE